VKAAQHTDTDCLYSIHDLEKGGAGEKYSTDTDNLCIGRQIRVHEDGKQESWSNEERQARQ
jgi:hypothetical protein